jgi:YfiH family protein
MARSLFTNRLGGASIGPFESKNLALHVGDSEVSVKANRKKLADEIGLSPEKIFYMNQVHGNQITVIDHNSDPGNPVVADGLYTELRNIALVTLVADCTPLLLFSQSAIAAVHVGRRGLIAGVVEATLETFKSHGFSMNDLQAEIGPAICKSCYQVDLDSYRSVVASEPTAGSDETKRCVDVSAGVSAKLTRAGVNHRTSNICVSHTPGYFSYRRDGITGRQAGVIWLS